MVEILIGAIALPDGTLVRGRGRREPMPTGPLPDFGLYLGRGRSHHLFRRDEPWQPDWAAAWIDWPDFRTPRDDQLAADLIERAYLLARGGRRVEVACGGGTGRTGTVVACMTVLAGCPAGEALTWTRHHYLRRAVETPCQRRWIDWFASHTGAR
ncbi:MAG: protein-tyrosine phosphatase family protein [Pseudonocardiaceae bacterium]